MMFADGGLSKMKKTFSARRVPRQIGQDDDEEPGAAQSGADQTSGSSIERPQIKSRKSSALRKTFRPSTSTTDPDLEDEVSSEATLIAPKRSGLSRLAVQRNAMQRSSTLASDAAARRADADQEGPSYSAASLQALKESTPSTPHDLTDPASSDVDEVSHSTRELDLSSKFGSSLARYQPHQPSSAIPSAAEIAEKKARRARLAAEHAADEYISLDPDDPGLDDDGHALAAHLTRDARGRIVRQGAPDKDTLADTRLARDDEDVMEGFDDFTEADSRIALGAQAEREAAQRRRRELAAQIDEAENGSGADDGDSDDSRASNASSRERNEVFEAAQTSRGLGGSRRTGEGEDGASQAPRPRIAPLPTLDGALGRLRARVTELQVARAARMGELEALRREKVRLAEEEVRIQKALRDTAEKFAALRAEKGVEGAVAPASGEGEADPALALLEAPPDVAEENGTEGLHRGLGFGMAGRGLESLGSSAVGTPVEGDEDGSE